MILNFCPQMSPEWWDLKKGRISGTRFSQVISTKKNRLIFDLLNERLNPFLFPSGFVTDAMQYGIDNEPLALEKYTEQTGIKVMSVGAIMSDFSDIHLASPDGVSECRTIVQEVKSTQDGGIHIQRYFEGIDAGYLPQVKNYFAVSDEVQEVHWMSFCPDRPERPLIIKIIKRAEYEIEVRKARFSIKMIEAKLNELEKQFKF